MKKLFILKNFLIGIVLVLASCDDILEQEPINVLTAKNFFLTARDAEAAVFGIYDAFQNNSSSTVTSQFILAAGDWQADVLEPTSNAPQYALEIMQVKSNVPLSSAHPVVGGLWEHLYRAVERSNQVIKYVPGITDAAIGLRREQLVGEAYFLRALAYFYLVRVYGEVPLRTEPIESIKDNLYVGKSSKDAIYALIVDDLSKAENSLPIDYKNQDGTPSSAQTRGRATVGASKALLAKVYLTRNDWTNALLKSSEVIAMSDVYTLAKKPTDFANLFSPVARNGNETIFALQHDINNGSNLRQTYNPIAVSGAYHLKPTTKIINAYQVTPPVDVRRGASISGTAPTEYVNKYATSLAANNDANLIILRLADVYLMQAEALNELKRHQEALVPVNIIRRRAFDVTDASVDLTTLDYETLKGAIEDERFKELAFEGHRWFDLVRTVGPSGKTRAEEILGVSPSNFYWPIPQIEIDQNPALQGG